MGLVAIAYLYARWNSGGLSSSIAVVAGKAAPGSPTDELPENVLAAAPIGGPIFERDHAALSLQMNTKGGARGPARLRGFVGTVEVSGASGVIPKGGWSAERGVGPATRGAVQASSWRLEAGDPMGLWRFTRKSPDREVALVLPRFTTLVIQPRVRELEASVAAPRSGSGTELYGVREYRPGDPLRRIHWRSSARHGELVVREFEPPGVQTLGIFCDPVPAAGDVADQIARLAASEAWTCIRNGGRVILWAPGQEPTGPTEARSLWALLEWLARYPTPTGMVDDPPSVSDAVGVMETANAHVIDALETVRRRGGDIRTWVIGDAEVDIEGVVQRAGTVWPL